MTRREALLGRVLVVVLFALSIAAVSVASEGPYRVVSSDPAEVDRCAASRDMFVGPGRLGDPNGAWYSTLTSNEAFDSLRTHRFLNTCTIQEITQAPPRAARVEQRILEGFPNGYTTVTRERDEVFVFYGTASDTAACTDEGELAGRCTFGPMTAKIDANTFTVVWKKLLYNSKVTGDWNYAGGIGVHANGFLYTIVNHRAFKQDPGTGEILKTTTLPTADANGQTAQDTVYNGFIVLRDGTLVTKSVTRQAGCTLQGLEALVGCADFSIPAYVSVLDPDTLQILSTVALPQAALGRVTSAVFGGKVYVYLPGGQPSDATAQEPLDYRPSRTYRFLYDERTNALRLDPDFTPVPYIRFVGQNPGTAVGVMGDHAVVQTNFSLKADHDLGITVFSQTDGRVEAYDEPFRGYPVSTLLGIAGRSVSSQLSLPTLDPEHFQIFSWDMDKGRFAGLQFHPRRRRLTTMWNVRQESNAFANLVGPADQRQIVLTNQVYVLFPDLFPKCSVLKTHLAECEQLVWRDSRTGRVLLRSAFQAGGFGAAIGVGFNGRFYTVTIKGDFIEQTIR